MLTFATLLIVSYILMVSINIGSDWPGLIFIEYWCAERYSHSNLDECISLLNTSTMLFEQTLSLALFLFVVVTVVMKLRWRLSVVLFAISLTVLAGIVPPQLLIENAVHWSLVLFLIGSMTLAGVLRGLGVFRYLAVYMVKIGRRNAYLMITLIAVLSYVTAAIFDEAISIVYVVMLLFEIARILGIDIVPLLVLSVLATNTGSSALPIGNPIGIYLLFAANLKISDFIRYALPLSLINFIVLLLPWILLMRKYIQNLEKALAENSNKIDAFIVYYHIEVEKREEIRLGFLILAGFIGLLVSSEYIVEYLSTLLGEHIELLDFLSFIPYVFILISLLRISVEKLPEYLHRAVEWQSIIFLISVSMLAYALIYSGSIIKLFYFAAKVIGEKGLLVACLFIFMFSVTMSILVDNFQIIVLYTPLITFFVSSEILPFLAYFALFYGAIFGGNYTPIGSTANEIAISMAEKKRIKITWNAWLKTAIITTTLQVIVALLWLYVNMVLSC